MGWKDDKNLGPWGFNLQAQKPSYNEGDHMATYASPVWSMAQGSDMPITPTHEPCGYWTKNYVPPTPDYVPPNDEYLIGWYKFNEGEGTVAVNSATDGSLGGGLLPDLTVYNIQSGADFWSFLAGFGSVTDRVITNHAYALLAPQRTLYAAANGGHGFGQFVQRISTSDDTGGLSLNLHLTYNMYGSSLIPWNGNVNNIILRRADTGRSIANAADKGSWYFYFIDSTNYGRAVKSDGTLLTTALTITTIAQELLYIHVGAGFGSTQATGGGEGVYGSQCSFGDTIIYNAYVPTLAEWA